MLNLWVHIYIRTWTIFAQFVLQFDLSCYVHAHARFLSNLYHRSHQTTHNLLDPTTRLKETQLTNPVCNTWLPWLQCLIAAHFITFVMPDMNFDAFILTETLWRHSSFRAKAIRGMSWSPFSCHFEVSCWIFGAKHWCSVVIFAISVICLDAPGLLLNHCFLQLCLGGW